MPEQPFEMTYRDLLWRHLVFDHGTDIYSAKRGDPDLMHNTVHTMIDTGHYHDAVGTHARDVRWETVYAAITDIGEVEGFADSEVTADLVEYRISIDIGTEDNPFIYTHMVDKRLVRRMYIAEDELFRFTWNRFVEMIDRELEKKASRDEQTHAQDL